MKNILLVAIISIFTFTNTNAQDSTIIVPELGKIDIAELQMKDCSEFPGSSAVNLLKYKQVELYIYPNGTTEVVTFTRYRIKIFNKNGYKYGTVTIPFSSENNIKLKNIQAATYNIGEDGQVKVTTVKEEDIFKNEEIKKSGLKSIKFAFPDIKEGSVLEYQVVRKFKMAYEVPSWFLQDNIPNMLVVYKVKRPISQLEKRVIADFPVTETHIPDYSKGIEQKRFIDTYFMRNVPAFHKEPFMSSSLDYKYRMDFLVDRVGLGPSNNIWYSANIWLLRSPYFGGAFEVRIPATKSFIDSVKNLENVPDKIRSIYNFVKHKIKWNHIYEKYARELTDVWKEGEGSSAEINLSILNLLRKCGIQSFPVLYSTRANGKVDYTFPDLSQFNTVNIAVVNGKKFNLLDGTDHYLSFETPPYNVVNRTGMLIDQLNHTKINIDFDRKLIWDSIFVSASVGADGILKGNIVKKYFDLARSRKLQNATEEENDEEADDKLSTKTSIKADTSWQVNIENELLPLIEHSSFHYEMPTTNDFYFLEPLLFSDLSKNPFIDSTRISDIDFGTSNASTIQIKIALQKGIKLEDIPKNKEMYELDGAIVFTYHNEIKNDTLYINSTLEIKKPIFDKKDYALVKKAFENIYSLLNNQVLFKKNKEE
ncbi:MAG: DUF3857 domain-containing protein [Agriterribacter sp.]